MSILDVLISADEAAQMWGLSPSHIKRLCRQGEIESKQIRSTWVILKNQPNPKQREYRKTIITVEKRKKDPQITGIEWIKEYTVDMDLDFIRKLDKEFVDKEKIRLIRNRAPGNYVLENGCFNYYVSVCK